VTAVATLDHATFRHLLGQAFEQERWVADAAWERGPFTSLEELDVALRAAIAGAGEERRLALVRSHPDLAGKLAVGERLSDAASREQASAGLDALTPEEHARFTELNTAYRERFGFPFVICVRDHTRESILEAFEQRLAHGRDEELTTALDQVARIAHLRLRDALA
jgi:OHCU decarboxylase